MKNGLANATDYYVKELHSGSDPSILAINYLKARGITKETATYFRLGLVEEPLLEFGHDFMQGRLSIPYVTPTGIVQIRFRAIPFDGIPGNPEPSPKILGESGATTTIYNVLDLANTEDTICVCEGELDTITAHQAGFKAIGIPGANAWQPIFGKILRFRKVIVLADNDDHGEGLKFAKTVQNDVRGARIVLMESGHDVNSFVMAEGEDALREKINGKKS
jgi:DNA primase